jgi:hypothetical protein
VLRSRPRGVHLVLRLVVPRRGTANDPSGRLPSGHGSPGGRHGGSDPAGTTRGRIREALPGGGQLARGRAAGGEGAFLPCTFLADNLVLQGRVKEARELFERLLAVRNDVGLLCEEYDPENKTMLGNFPQAFTHVSLINTALNLTSTAGPAHHRHSAE